MMAITARIGFETVTPILLSPLSITSPIGFPQTLLFAKKMYLTFDIRGYLALNFTIQNFFPARVCALSY
jgi:hypothetical protein